MVETKREEWKKRDRIEHKGCESYDGEWEGRILRT